MIELEKNIQTILQAKNVTVIIPEKLGYTICDGYIFKRATQDLSGKLVTIVKGIMYADFMMDGKIKRVSTTWDYCKYTIE